MPSELGAVLELELALSGLFDRHRQEKAASLRFAREPSAELFIDEDPAALARRAPRDRPLERLEDERLGVGDLRSDGWREPPGRAEEPTSERGAMIEGDEEQRLAVAELHGILRPFCVSSRARRRR
jgi:hypothetical protein